MIFSLLDSAKHSVVHDFKGGAVALAPLVNMNSMVLSNKCNPNQDTHHLTVDEAVAIQNATKDFRILRAEAATLNHVCVPVGDFEDVSDVELLTLYAAYHAELGETAGAIMEALADGDICRAEVDLVREEMFEDFQRGLEFLSRMEALCED